ncbi:MAG: PQQ-binding-like beta-propeller repeat protein [Planctomycetes bacterium]|nr:PQQ-binding-like beta-propeller repeat protein [Planctomycetota bacterium]
MPPPNTTPRAPNFRRPAGAGLFIFIVAAIALSGETAARAQSFNNPDNFGQDPNSTFGRQSDEFRPKITLSLIPNNVQKEFDFSLNLLQEGHVADALATLQPFVSHYANRLVPVQYLANGSVQAVKESDTWLGVAYFLQKYLENLPPETLEQIEKIDGPSARARYETALAARSLEGLLRLHQELPWTAAGVDAIAAVASILLERGDVDLALAYYRRLLTLQSYKTNPDVVARVAMLETALGGKAKIPREVAGEFADVGGQRVALKSLANINVKLSKTARPGYFSTATGELPLDPGEIKDKNPWRKRLLEEPPGSVKSARAIYPIISDETIYISNGWSLAAFDLVLGKPRWNDPAFASKWDRVNFSDRQKFTEGEDDKMALAPAVANGIVVVPLMVPLKTGSQVIFQSNIPVKEIIPYRKLHAFDAKSGAPIWDHWRSETALHSTDFIDKYRCSGPPIIAGNLVIAPLYEMPDDATVEYHLAAFKLRTGELVWDTPIVTGTTPINMFGRTGHEFASGPAAVDGDRVYISTDLGALACVDTGTGGIVWVQRYKTTPYQRNAGYQSYGEPRQYMAWSVNPPALSAETVIFAPWNSDSLLALDRETGRRVAHLAANDPIPERSGRSFGSVRHLLGIIDHTIYLAGDIVVALDAPSIDSPRFQTRAVWPESGAKYENRRQLRPTLTESTIIVPQMDEMVVIDNKNLRRMHGIPWAAEGSQTESPGHVVVGDGVIIVINNPDVTGHSNLEILVGNARRAQMANPNDPQIQERLGRCLRMRGETAFRNHDFGAAISDLDEAETYLFKSSENSDVIASLLLTKGRAHEGRGETAESIKAFKRAFESARDVDLRIEAGCVFEKSLPRESENEKLQLIKALESLAGARRGDVAPYGEIPYGLYFIFRRADIAVPRDVSGEIIKIPGAHTEAAISALQEVIRSFATEEIAKLHTSAGKLAEEKINDIIRVHGRDSYKSVEAEARRRFESLTDRSSPEEFGEIARFYPNSIISKDAAFSVITQLIKTGNPKEALVEGVSILSLSESEPEIRRVCLACARALEKLENPWLAAVYEARAKGAAAPRTNIYKEVRGPAAPFKTSTPPPGRLSFMGVLRPALNDGSAGDILFAFSQDNLYGLRSTASVGADANSYDNGESPFNAPLPRSIRKSTAEPDYDYIQFPFATVLNGIITIAHGGQVQGYKIRPQGEVFSLQFDGEIAHAAAAAGAIVVTIRGDSDHDAKAVCIDAVSGAVLWTRQLEHAFEPYIPVANASQVVLLPCGGDAPRKMVRFDLATGARLDTFRMPEALETLLGKHLKSVTESEKTEKTQRTRRSGPIQDRIRELAQLYQIYDNKLLFARPGSDGFVSALDLATGSIAWTSKPVENTRMKSILFANNEVLVLKEYNNASAGEELVSLDAQTGDPRILMKLPSNANIAGIPAYDACARWREPMVVALTSSSVRGNVRVASTRIDALDLATGRTWTSTMPVRVRAIEPQTLPGIGAETVAIAYSYESDMTDPLNEMRIFKRDTGNYAIDRAFALPGRPFGIVTTDSSFAVLAPKAQQPDDVQLLRLQTAQSTDPKSTTTDPRPNSRPGAESRSSK